MALIYKIKYYEVQVTHGKEQRVHTGIAILFLKYPGSQSSTHLKLKRYLLAMQVIQFNAELHLEQGDSQSEHSFGVMLF